MFTFEAFFSRDKMKTSNAYQQIVKWQKARNICLGDQVRFFHKGRRKSGYLTGFDMEHSPLRLIVRYVNKLGFMQVVTVEPDAVITKMESLQVV